MRQVGRADVRGVKAGVSFEEPGLGVEPRLRRLVRDLHLGSEPDKLVERTLFGGARVHAGDDAHLPASEQEFLQFSPHQTDTGKSHEGAEQVDAVGALDLQWHLGPNLQILVSVDEQGAIPERNPWARCWSPLGAARYAYLHQ